ncbi:MAG: DNA-3-methyladenine glycosylase [Candidatus Dojkabacteria bacterium]|nr:MAG: DNA-3-methyladenine glycosylase [Candidatus Dojkabacteria bacterium]
MNRLEEVKHFFEQQDPAIYAQLLTMLDLEPISKTSSDQYFIKLCRSIIYQQLSGKAAGTIYGRYEQLFDGEITPEKVVAIEQAKLRNAGLSNAKGNYVKNIAAAALDGTVQFEKLDDKDDQYVIDHLTQIKGVGQWTAEMFLMFTLGREDVFSLGDLGLRKGFQKLYGYKKIPSSKTILSRSKRWSPYRTYASMALWSAADS